MKSIAFGKGKRLANIAGLVLAQSAVPTLHVRHLPAILSHRLMGFLWKHFLVGLPEVAVGNATAIILWNFVPQTATGFFATLANDKGDDLSSSTAHHRPQPALVDLFEHKTPRFIIFQNIVWLRWQHSVLEFGQTLNMSNNPSGDTLTMNAKNPLQSSQTYALLVGTENDWLLRFFTSRFDSRTRWAPQSLQ